MENLEKILEGLDRINAKLEEVLKLQKADKVVWPNQNYSLFSIPPKKSHKEITNG
jgi:hypothetical protein